MIDIRPFLDELEAARIRIFKNIDDYFEVRFTIRMYELTGQIFYKHV